jgi:GNAT superfamily N-acetyltransferase
MMTIKEVFIDQILPIRQQVMWPEKPIDFVRVPEDENGIHFGLFVEENLISVVSVFIHRQEAQFRKFATLEQFQGKGYGSKLLQYIFDFLEAKNTNRIWCNARISKAGYYQKFGMTTTDATFEKEGMEYVGMERVFEMHGF